jgi:hypothetical protein
MQNDRDGLQQNAYVLDPKQPRDVRVLGLRGFQMTSMIQKKKLKEKNKNGNPGMRMKVRLLMLEPPNSRRHIVAEKKELKID